MLTHRATKNLYQNPTEENTAKELAALIKQDLAAKVTQVLRFSTPLFVFQKLCDGQCFIGEAFAAWNDMVLHTTAALTDLPGYCDAMLKEWTMRCQTCPQLKCRDVRGYGVGQPWCGV